MAPARLIAAVRPPTLRAVLRGAPPRLFGALAFPLAPFAAGCAQIAGSDEYSVRSNDGDEGFPPEVAIPFLTGVECEACARDECGGALSACEASATCSGWLAGIRANPGPLTAYEWHRADMENNWIADRGGVADETIRDLRECAAQKCLSECQVGQDYSCVGRFEWNIDPPSQLRIRVTTDPKANAISVNACLGVNRCTPPLQTATTDANGFAVLALAGEYHVDFLQLEVPESLPWQWFQSRPVGTGDYVRASLFNDLIVRGWYDDFNRTFDESQGLLIVQPWDCNGINAKQISAEVWLNPASGREFCDRNRCVYAYPLNFVDTPDPLKEVLDTAGHVVYVATVPAGRVQVLLRRSRAPREVVSITRLNVRGGAISFIRAFPASTEELSGFVDPRG